MNLNTNFSNLPSFNEDTSSKNLNPLISSNLNEPINETNNELSIHESVNIDQNVITDSSSSLNPMQKACNQTMAQQDYEKETINALTNLITLNLKNPNSYEFISTNKTKAASLAQGALIAGKIAQPIDAGVKSFVNILDSINNIETIDAISSLLQNADRVVNAEITIMTQARVIFQATQLPKRMEILRQCEAEINDLRTEIKNNPNSSEIKKLEYKLTALLKNRQEIVVTSYKNLVTYSLKASAVDAKVLSGLVSKFSNNATTINCFALLAGVLGGVFQSYRTINFISDLVENNNKSQLLLNEIKLNHEIINKKEVDPSIRKVIELRNKNLDIQYADNGSKTICNALLLSSSTTGLTSGVLLVAGKIAATAAIGLTGTALGVLSATASIASGIFFLGGIGIGAAYLGYRKNKDIRLGIKYKLAERKLSKENQSIQNNMRIKNLYNIQIKKANEDLKLYNLKLNNNNETVELKNLKSKINDLNNEVNNNPEKKKLMNDLAKLTKTSIKDLKDLERLPMKNLIEAEKTLNKLKNTTKSPMNHKILSNLIYYNIGIKKEKKEIRDLQNKIKNSKIMIGFLQKKINILGTKIEKSDLLIKNIFKNNLEDAKSNLATLKKNYEMQKFASEFGLPLSELNTYFEEINSSIKTNGKDDLKKFFINNNINVDFFDIDPTFSIIEYCRKKAA